MTVPVTDPAAAELTFLLNQAVLRLSPDVRMRQLAPDRLVLKYEPARLYLIVSPGQWDILQHFKSGATVTQVLCDLIADQRDPSLRELYELVVKAARAGVLQAEGYPVPPVVLPSKWAVGLPGIVARWLAVVALVAAGAGVALHPPGMPETALWFVAGWAAVCLAASLGTLLAGSVVKSGGGDVYGVRLQAKSLLPRLEAGLEDALMGGRPLAGDAALAQLLPPFALLAAAPWALPALHLPLLFGTLVVLCPFWNSPLLALLGARYRELRLSTDEVRVIGAEGRAARLRSVLADRRFLSAWLLSALAWTALTLVAAGLLLPEDLRSRLGWSPTLAGVQQLGFVLGAVLGLMLVLGLLGLVAWMLWRGFGWWRERSERRLRPADVLVSPQTIAAWLGQTILFRDLPPEELAAVAAAVKPEEHRGGSYVVKEGDPGERLYIVLSGRLEVRRDYAPGRSEPVAEMGEGDVFGEIALLQGGPRTRSIRSLGRSVLLGLDKADFERLVLSSLSRQAVEDAVQKVGFLQHTQLTRNWSHATMAAFARRAKFHEMAEGTVMIEEGKRNPWFFVLHRGEVSVQIKGREVRRLQAGESFGELSLLGTGHATATIVVASKTASVLSIAGLDFLDFVSHDFTVGLAWEGSRKARRDHRQR